MDIHITGRNSKVSDAMKGHAAEKLAKLDRHNDLVTRAEVVLSVDKVACSGEMIAHTKVGVQVVGKAEHNDMYACIDLLLDKMDHLLTKHKEKVKTEKKHSRTKASGETPAGAARHGTGPSAKRLEQIAEGEQDETYEEER